MESVGVVSCDMLVNWIHTDVHKSGLCYTVQAGMWYRHDPDCQSVIAHISNNKQLVDSQIGVNSIPSRECTLYTNVQ